MSVSQIAIALAIVALPLVCRGESPPSSSPSHVSAAGGQAVGAQPNMASEIGSDDPVDPDTGMPASCDFVKILAHPDPSVLLREFLERDSSGEFLQASQWFNGATECPGHEGAHDGFELIAGYDVSQMVVRGPSASATVRYLLLER
jgi:hypothetical protein